MKKLSLVAVILVLFGMLLQIFRYYVTYNPVIEWLIFILIFVWCSNLMALSFRDFYQLPEPVVTKITLTLIFHFAFFLIFKFWIVPLFKRGLFMYSTHTQIIIIDMLPYLLLGLAFVFCMLLIAMSYEFIRRLLKTKGQNRKRNF